MNFIKLRAGLIRIVGTFLALFSLSWANAQIINGSFESPNIADGSSISPTTGDSTSIPGWTVIGGGDVQLVDQQHESHWVNLPAADGRQWVDLTGIVGFNKGISTTFQGIAGQNYVVSFSLGRLTHPWFQEYSAMQVLIDGQSAGVFKNALTGAENSMVWQALSANFSATGDVQTLGFIGFDAGEGSSYTVVGLDAVAVNAVPEPSTYALMALGLGAVAYRARRRRSVTVA